MQYIDIHSHNKPSKEDVLRVHNLFPEDVNLISDDSFYSLGIHPWYIEDANLNIIEEYAQNENVIAIGEIGLDKLKPNHERQKELFIQQIEIAKSVNKPIILHCVRAYSEVLEILKQTAFELPVIFHWFSGGPTLAKQLTDKGYYLSFGQSLFHEKLKRVKGFIKTPLEHIFYETDASKYTIEEVYAKASELKNIPLKELQNAVIGNFYRIFNSQTIPEKRRR